MPDDTVALWLDDKELIRHVGPFTPRERIVCVPVAIESKGLAEMLAYIRADYAQRGIGLLKGKT